MPGLSRSEVREYYHHWIFKAIQHIIMTGFISYYLINDQIGKFSNLSYVIFYISQIAFILQYIAIYFIFSWIPEENCDEINNKNKSKFKSLLNLCCKGS